MKKVNKEIGEEIIVDYMVDWDECNCLEMILEGL